jgi:hypothetical protein
MGMGSMTAVWRKLATILGLPFYRRLAFSLAAGYLVLFLMALQNITFSGQGVQVLTTHGSRMFERTGTFTFEPIAQLTFPGLTILLSPLNLVLGLFLSLLVGLNLAVTVIAFRYPAACRFNRGTGLLASVPGLLSGGACCAPTIVLILGIQMSSAFITVFQVLIPASALLLLITLKLILDRTTTELIAA